MTGNFGVSGERTDQTLARLDAALGSGAGTLYISEGINSIAQAPYTHAVSGLTVAVSACGAQALADTMKKVDAGLSLGMKVIVALCHSASSFTGQHIAQLAIYNGGLRRAAEVRANLWLLDVPAILHDPSTTPSSLQFRTGCMRSESPVVHEAGPGAYYVGKEFAKILIDVMRPIPRNAIHRSNQRSPDNRTQLALNPLFNATSGTAGVLGGGGGLAAGTAAVPYEWTFSRNSGDSTTSFTVGVKLNAAGNGNDVIISYNVTTAGGDVRMYQDLGGAGTNGAYWIAGDVIQGFATTMIVSGSTGLSCARPSLEINGTTGGVTNLVVSQGLVSDTSHGTFPSTETIVFEDSTEPVTIPAFDTNNYLSLKALNLICATPGTGTVRVNMPHFDISSTLVG